MALIPEAHLPYFENQLYLPLVLTILSRDRATIERGAFKLPAPYLRLIDETADYMRANKLRLERGAVGDTFTTYIFYYGGYTEERRYLNVRLRNRTEELLEIYLMRGSI